jgi:hypothetical protein
MFIKQDLLNKTTKIQKHYAVSALFTQRVRIGGRHSVIAVSAGVSSSTGPGVFAFLLRLLYQVANSSGVSTWLDTVGEVGIAGSGSSRWALDNCRLCLNLRFGTKAGVVQSFPC